MSQTSPDRDELEEASSQTTSGAIADIEKTFLRLTFWQTILSVAGVFTGAVALYAALTESQAVRQQTAASVWPYVQLMINDTSNDDSASFALSLSNVGVGPARMQGARVTYQGEPVADWQTMTELLMGNEARLGTTYGKSSVSRRVLAPGESVVAIQTSDTELALSLQAAVYAGTLAVSYCYCSIFDECWVKSSSGPADQAMSPSLPACPDHGAASFRD